MHHLFVYILDKKTSAVYYIWWKNPQLFVYIFDKNISCLFTYFQLLFTSLIFKPSGVCLHFQLFVYISNYLFTFSSFCLHSCKSSLKCQGMDFFYFFLTKYRLLSQCEELRVAHFCRVILVCRTFWKVALFLEES